MVIADAHVKEGERMPAEGKRVTIWGDDADGKSVQVTGRWFTNEHADGLISGLLNVDQYLEEHDAIMVSAELVRRLAAQNGVTITDDSDRKAWVFEVTGKASAY